MKHLRRVLRWIGLAMMTFGVLTVVWSAVVVVQYQTGWGLTLAERANDQWGTLALAGFVSGMFFVLTGAGGVLISRMRLLRPSDETDEGRPARWTRPVVVLLFVCGAGSIALATVFAGMADQFGEATIGIVSYCMLIGVGLLFAGWGLKRARDPQVPGDDGLSR